MKNISYLAILLLSLNLAAGKRGSEVVREEEPPAKRLKSDLINSESDSESNSEDEIAIIEEYEITSFEQIFDYIQPFIGKNKEILLVLDWDNTITKINGESTPMREGEYTKVVLELLQDLGVKAMILTARLNGQSLEHPKDVTREKIQQAIADTLNGLELNEIDLQKSAALSSNNYEEFYLEHTDCHVVIQNQFVFAGCYKGEALLAILSSPRLDFAPDVIVFVDDQYPNIESVRDALMDTLYSVVLLHYPDPEADNQGVSGSLICDESLDLI